MYLRRLIRIVRWDKRKYTKAQIDFYKDVLCAEKKVPIHKKRISFETKFCYLLPYDLTIMLGFHTKVVKSEKIKIIIDKIVSDFNLPKEQAAFFDLEFKAALGNPSAWEKVCSSDLLKDFTDYLELIKKNIDFIKTKPYNILITATMSAGKSTLINSLAGKNISLMQNMACTSKIHTIVSKFVEDGVSSEYDYDFSIDASKEDLLKDNGDNKSHKITVGTCFNGQLGGKRIILLDSPGVNSFENTEHGEIAHRIIKSRKYNLLIYVLNSTQLGTTDEEYHLEIVRQGIGQTKVIFVMNKVDQLISDDDNFIDSIERQKRFLISKGFKNPLICPVSSRAAYLAKKRKSEELSRIEHSELEILKYKFERERLDKYYEEKLGCPHILTDNKEDVLLVNCGFAHFEKMILNFYNGGKENGTGICQI